jgi:hypothetical protein
MERILLKQRLPTWDPQVTNTSPELVAIAEQCCSKEASLRPSFDVICNMLQQQLIARGGYLPQQQQQQGVAAAAAAGTGGWERMQQVKGNAAPAAAAAGREEDHCDGCSAASSEELQQAVSGTLSTAWLDADEQQEMLQAGMCLSSNNSNASDSATTALAAAASTPRAAAAGFVACSSSSTRRSPPCRAISFGPSAATHDALLYTIPEVSTGLVQLDAVSDGGAGSSRDGTLDALHNADRGLVKTLGKVRRLSNSSSCSAGAFAAGVDGALGGVSGVAAAADGNGSDFEAEAAAAATRLQQMLQKRQITMGGVGQLRCVHVDLGGFADADDPAADWLLGRLTQHELDKTDAAAVSHADAQTTAADEGGEQGGASGWGTDGVEQQSRKQQQKQRVYASAGPPSGPHSGYW